MKAGLILILFSIIFLTVLIRISIRKKNREFARKFAVEGASYIGIFAAVGIAVIALVQIFSNITIKVF